MKNIIAFVLVAITACSSIRPKQWAGAGLTIATLPVNVEIDNKPARIGLTFALLVGAVALLESDANRDRTGERVTLVYPTAGPAPKIGEFIQEVCSPNQILCTGPYQVYEIRAVRPLAHKRYALSATVVPVAPRTAAVRTMILHGPAEVAVMGDAWGTVEGDCQLGCGDSTTGNVTQPEN